jgi:hypothetical protein
MDLAAVDVRLGHWRNRLPDALPDVHADLPDASNRHRAVHLALKAEIALHREGNPQNKSANKSGSPSHYGKGLGVR